MQRIKEVGNSWRKIPGEPWESLPDGGYFWRGGEKSQIIGVQAHHVVRGWASELELLSEVGQHSTAYGPLYLVPFGAL